VPRSHVRLAAVALGGLIVAAIVARALLAGRIATPWILVDEYIYSELAKSFAEHGRFLVNGYPYAAGKVYPALISPAWFWHSMSVTYGIAKTLNAVLMSLAAVPAYLWARRLVSPLLALVAAALVLFLPAFVYTGTLMTENAAFPTFLLATFAIALALERPTLWAQAFALAASGLASAVRVQAVVLFAILAVAVGLKVLLDLRVRAGRASDLLRPYLPMLAGLALLALAYVGLKLAEHASLSSGLGTYAVVVHAGYSWGELPHWFLYHLAELSLAVGVVPLAALGVLAALAAVRGLPGPAERSFVAIAVPAVVLLVFQVALFASRFSLRIEERNMIYAMPILLLALVVWIGRGLPRPAVIAPAAAFGSAALLVGLPLEMFLNRTILSDTFALVPLLRLESHLAGDIRQVRWIMLFAAFDAALAFLLLPRRVAAVALPLILAGYFAFVSSVVIDEASTYSRAIRTALPANGSWIDERLGSGADAAYLFGGNIDPAHESLVLWELKFWNRTIRQVYSIGGAATGLPGGTAVLGPNGELSSIPPGVTATRFLVADSAVSLGGRRIAHGNEAALYAASRPPRIIAATRGIYGDGWTGGDAGYARYSTPGGSPGRLAVSVSRAAWTGPDDKPGHVEIAIGPAVPSPSIGAGQLRRVTARRRWTVHALTQRTFVLPAPRPPFAVSIKIDPTFSPADYPGWADTRQLGAQVAFTFTPSR